jgi:3',5'-cyclic AMP phosphodiesterase CpdA
MLTRLTFCAVMAVPALLSAQTPVQPPVSESVVAIKPPLTPLPAERASAGVTRFSYIVYGDTRGRRDGAEPQYEHSLVVDQMLRTIAQLKNGPDPVKFVLQSGDAVVNGRDAKQWNVSFVGLINRLTTEGGVPYFLAPGNHDVTAAADLNAPGRKDGLRNYLQAVSGLIPQDGTLRRLNGYPTYAFGYGNTFVIAFDSNIATDSTQYAWIRAQLAGLDRKRYAHVVAVFHHPAFSSGPHGGAIVEGPTAAVRARYMPLFREFGVELLVTGHEHLYEHWVERYRDSTGAARRIDQIVTGGGGAPLYSYQGEPDLRSYVRTAPADSIRLEHVVRPGMNPGDNPYHFVVVHVDGARVWLEVIGVDWGRGFQPYKSARSGLGEGAGVPR